MNIHLLRRIILSVFFFAGIGVAAFSQDLIAKQAPVDRRLRAVDSVTIQRAVERDELLNFSDEIYSSWVTNLAHPYKSSEVPDSFTIDLRGFCMPTPSRQVTSGYGYRKTFRRMHKGLDVKVYTGDTIVAAFDGKVRVVQYDRNGYGKYVVIRHNNGLETIYGHLSKQLVETDQVVKAGEPIGLGGNTGRSFGSHLHFETRVVGEPINPELLFNFPEQDVTADYYTFHKGQNDSSSKSYASSGSTSQNSGSGSSSRYYKVKKGETLSAISKKLGRSVNDLVKTNHLKSASRIRAGQILRY